MAATPVVGAQATPGGTCGRLVQAEHNNVIDDMEVLRAAIINLVRYEHEELAAGVDISARPVFVAPAAITILDSVKYLPRGNSAGIDGGNTLVLTLRNITAGEDIATITRTTDLVGGTAVALTLTAANADVASGAAR